MLLAIGLLPIGACRDGADVEGTALPANCRQEQMTITADDLRAYAPQMASYDEPPLEDLARQAFPNPASLRQRKDVVTQTAQRLTRRDACFTDHCGDTSSFARLRNGCDRDNCNFKAAIVFDDRGQPRAFAISDTVRSAELPPSRTLTVFSARPLESSDLGLIASWTVLMNDYLVLNYSSLGPDMDRLAREDGSVLISQPYLMCKI